MIVAPCKTADNNTATWIHAYRLRSGDTEKVHHDISWKHLSDVITILKPGNFMLQ